MVSKTYLGGGAAAATGGGSAAAAAAIVDPRSLTDAHERVSREDAARFALMKRQRERVLQAETPTAASAHAPTARREQSRARALSYCGDERKLAAYLRHHEADAKGAAPAAKYAAMRIALCAAILDGTEEEVEATQTKLNRAKRRTAQRKTARRKTTEAAHRTAAQ